jgi:hypothetical protein
VSRFNVRTVRPTSTSPVATTGETTRTYEGGTGHLRDAKSELFLLAVSNFVSADTFYEKGGDRDDRYTQLVRSLAVSDPDWTAGLLGWLRGDGNMRTASLVGAAEFVRARLDANQLSSTNLSGTVHEGWNRTVIDSVLQRPDEPGELLAYWTSRYGRNLPKPVKRGIADAVGRLYNERALLKYDTDSKGYRFGDVLELVHAAPDTGKAWQGDLFKHAIDRRHGRDNEIPATLRTVRSRNELFALPVDQRRAVLTAPDGVERLAAAGVTWEALAGWLQGPMDATAWEAVAPSMGYMATLRNLRNFEEASVSDATIRAVCAKLADPEQVARSRQLPFRFWSAYKHTNGTRFADAIEQGLTHCLRNIPKLDGASLVLVDTSASMTTGMFDKNSHMTPVQAGALFGVALAAANPASVDLYGFASGEFPHQVKAGASVLRETERFIARVGEVGHGTDIHGAVQRQSSRRHYRRIFIISDMQTIGGSYGIGNGTVPRETAVYGFNLGGYRQAMMATGTGNQHEFGGLTDATFRQVPLLERGVSSAWPWLERSA